MIRIILLDDHALIRRGLRETLSEETDFRIVGEASDYGELRELLRTVECDVLLLDMNLPGRSGLDVLKVLADEGSPIRSLVVSMYPEDQYALRALKAGALGYVNKSAETNTLLQAVRTVAMGRKFITPEIASALVETLTAPTDSKPHERLSDREYQTMILIASGYKLSEIAEKLTLSPKTVSVYRARLLEKMTLSNNAELTHYALKNDLLS
ncbi:MAG: response regulator transcription factor [Burkholderiales bacterium]|nr:response regulator transcription factor [Burkholderiales bacterium]PKO40676.1 MAG: DNA-binding response regulator [Betaproteobacteria bacterium HGW-Betaproteobacteria-3]